VIPAATGAPRALAIFTGYFAFANPVNGQLPNAVFDLRQNVIHAHRTLMRVQARDRRGVTQSPDGCSKATKGRIFVTENFRCPRKGLR